MRHQKKALVEQIRNRQIRYDRRKKNESRKQRQNKIVGERRSHLQSVVARDVSVRPPQSAFYLWQRHASLDAVEALCVRKGSEGSGEAGEIHSKVTASLCGGDYSELELPVNEH